MRALAVCLSLLMIVVFLNVPILPFANAKVIKNKNCDQAAMGEAEALDYTSLSLESGNLGMIVAGAEDRSGAILAGLLGVAAGILILVAIGAW